MFLSSLNTVGQEVVECYPIHQSPWSDLLVHITSEGRLPLRPVLTDMRAYDGGRADDGVVSMDSMISN